MRKHARYTVLALWLGVSASAQALNDAQFISQSVPATMAPGQSYAVSVTMQNTGNTTWTAGSLYRLGSQNPQDNTTWGMLRVELPADVAPGASVTFTFNVTAPATVGTYNFQWRMVQDGVQWFGASTPNVAVKDGVNDAAFVSQDVPSTMTPGQTYAASVTMQNTGNTTWTAGSLYRLGSQNPQDNTTWGMLRVELPNSVAPGASVTFSFNVTAPATVGTYNFQWRMVQDTVEWFGAYTTNVAVRDGVNDATFVSQSVPATMTPGQTYAVSVTMQNTGNTTWTAGSLYRLGSQNPQDNTTWGLLRVELPSSVAPGASVTFTFNVAAPATVGTYNFQWRMVQDTVEWFGALTANVAVSVQGAAAAQVFYIYPDHLNTPRLITNNVGQAVWQWANDDPFGSNAPNENPSGLGTFTFNLRFSGQYFDKELNTHQNYFRDYDPAIGRYIQSDPLGLRAGINTYNYVENNPLSYFDREGLKAERCLACIAYAEAGGTNDECRRAVISVIRNRTYDPKNFPGQSDACLVASAPGQFNAYGTHRWRDCMNDCLTGPEQTAANAVLVLSLQLGIPDPTNGATFFHDNSIPTPSYLQRGIRSGRYSEVRIPGCRSFRFYTVN